MIITIVLTMLDSLFVILCCGYKCFQWSFSQLPTWKGFLIIQCVLTMAIFMASWSPPPPSMMDISQKDVRQMVSDNVSFLCLCSVFSLSPSLPLNEGGRPNSALWSHLFFMAEEMKVCRQFLYIYKFLSFQSSDFVKHHLVFASNAL